MDRSSSTRPRLGAGVRVLAAIGAANALVACLHFGLAAGGPQLREGLVLGEDRLGLLLAAIPAGLMFGTFAWGELADRLGERRSLVAAYATVVLACATGAALGRAAWQQQPGSALLAALGGSLFVAGLAGSAAHSAGGRAIVEAFPAHVHARVLAIRHTLIPVGGTIGGLLVPWLLHVGGLAWVLGASAGAAVLVVVGIQAALPPDTIVARRARDDADRAMVDAAADGEQVHPRGGGGGRAARGSSPLAHGDLWLLGGSCSMLALVQLTLVSFLTLHLVDEAGLRFALAATIFSVAQLTGAAGRIALGAVADRTGDPAAILAGVTASSAVLLVLAMLAPSRVEGMLLAIVLLVVTSWNGVAVAAAARLAPEGRTGATLGMQTTMFATMGVFAPIGAGIVLAGAGWAPLLVTGVVALSLATVGLLGIRPRLRRPATPIHDP